jgi:hypothetical protein
VSTKIYVAYRFPVARLNEFFDLTAKIVFDRAAERIKQLMETAVDEKKAKEQYDNYAKGWKNSGYTVPPYLMTGVRLGLVLELCRTQSKSVYRDPIVDVEFGWNVWINADGFAYVIPWGEHWIRKDLKLPKWCEDFCYWNNTDPPDDIPYEEFKKRGEIWDPMITNWDAYRMAHPVVSFKPDESFSTEHRLRQMIHPGYDKEWTEKAE